MAVEVRKVDSAGHELLDAERSSLHPNHNCKVKKAIIDKHNYIPEGVNIGVDPTDDKARFKVTPRGITVVPKGYFPAE